MLDIMTALYALQMHGVALDGEAAVGQAQRALKELGVQEKLSLEALTDHSYLTTKPCWYVQWKSERGPITIVLDARTGKTLFVQARPDPALNRLSNSPPTPASTRHAREMLHQLGYDQDVTLSARSGFASGPTGGVFYRTLHGLTFFNMNPTYGHRLVFDPRTGAINYFLPSPPLPPVNGWSPEISGPIALEKIRLWAEQRAQALHKGLNTEGKRVAELGYWKFNGEEHARLVWRSASYSVLNGAMYGGGAYRILVDALTGEVKESDDPAIGANP